MLQDFNIHTHTKRCGHAEENYLDEDYIKEAIDAGMRYLCFTDHMPFPKEMDEKKNLRMEYNTKCEYIETINKLKEKYKNQIKIESGFEIEYIPGKEKHLEELKKETDKLIIGQHLTITREGTIKYIDSGMTDEELSQYADLIVRAIELGIPNIIAHPDYFMKYRRGFGREEEKASIKICEVASKYDIPVEINLGRIHNKSRNMYEDIENIKYEDKIEKMLKIIEYPCNDFWKIAAEYNLKVLYGCDAHFRGQLLDMQEYIKIANNVIGKESLLKLSFINENFKIIV